MDSLTILLIFSSHILLQLAFLNTAQPNFMNHTCHYDRGNYTVNSPYQRNLGSLLSSLESNNETDYGFYNLSVGQPPNQVNSIAFCRGDVGREDCKSCIRDASRKILEICPNQTDAIGVYDFCRLRYSNSTIFGVVDVSHTFFTWNTQNAWNVNQYIQAQETLFDRLRTMTASRDSIRKFAKGNESAGFERMFALMQCSPDLSYQRCDDCLAQAISDIVNCCAGKISASVIKPSCDVRYDNKLFYDPAEPVAPPPPPLGSQVPESSSPPPPLAALTEGHKSNTARIIIILLVPTVGVVIIFIICYYIFSRRKKPSENALTTDARESPEITPESLQVAFATVKKATNDFSAENKLGQGGFGAVYKGTLPNGREIAVKRLSKNSSGQRDSEFKNEVLVVAKLQHRNLVRLLGFCLERNERLLIFEFLPNTSLDKFLFDPIKRHILNWERRQKIICGVTRGLLYLHRDSRFRIIHHDLKAGNILLDADFKPKVADFGLARLIKMDQSKGKTKQIAGTHGYMAPEYIAHGNFSVKSDVFSFGVLLLEILSGRKNLSYGNGEILLSYTWRNWREGTPGNVIDSSLSSGLSNEMTRCIQIALLCIQDVATRPAMSDVVSMLNSSDTLAEPSQPAFLCTTALGYNLRVTESRAQDDDQPLMSRNEASITELYPR